MFCRENSKTNETNNYYETIARRYYWMKKINKYKFGHSTNGVRQYDLNVVGRVKLDGGSGRSGRNVNGWMNVVTHLKFEQNKHLL